MVYLTVSKTHYSIDSYLSMKHLSFYFFSFLLFVSLFSCKRQENASKFFSDLKVIDGYISLNESEKALNALIALGQSVKDARQSLAVSKRMLIIGAIPEAIKFLTESSSLYPDSPEVAGLLIATLIDAGHHDSVGEYESLVKNSIYSSLVAEASAFKKDVNGFMEIEPYCWEAAYRLTGEQAFLKTSAISLCREGKISQAEFLREAIAKDSPVDDPFFWSCVSYDLGHFNFLFKSLDSTILNAEEVGVFEKNKIAVEKASRHLLLAADAAYGTGDIDIARSYWHVCADLPHPFPIALYNLALTSETEEEKAKFFVECITRYPAYYPAVASYIRQYLALKETENLDDVTKYLADRGFYSMKMEDVYLSLPNMVYSPDALLKVALNQEDCDPRIAIEYFRYKYYKGGNFKAGISDMWKLLEDYPDSPDVRSYAKWYFSRCRDFNACFSVGQTGDEALDAFYLGLEKAIKSSKDTDIIDSFTKAASVEEYKVFATANIAYVYYQQKLRDKAIETLSVAASIAEDSKTKSRLHYQLARMLAEIKSYDRAISVLNYSVELDSENYPAQVLLEKLQSLK